MNSPDRDRRALIVVEPENPSRESSRTQKGDIPWDSVHPTIRFRSSSSMSFSLSERQPWPTGSDHPDTTPQKEASEEVAGQGRRLSSPVPFVSPHGLFFPLPLPRLSGSPLPSLLRSPPPKSRLRCETSSNRKVLPRRGREGRRPSPDRVVPSVDSWQGPLGGRPEFFRIDLLRRRFSSIFQENSSLGPAPSKN